MCVWAGVMLLALAALNTCSYIQRFTRFSGELFGGLIAILFLQQFVQGVCDEFRIQSIPDYPMCARATSPLQARTCLLLRGNPHAQPARLGRDLRAACACSVSLPPRLQLVCAS